MAATDNPEDCTVLYKILTEDEHMALFSPAPAAGTLWPGTSLDVNDGFIHSSTSAQVHPAPPFCPAPLRSLALSQLTRRPRLACPLSSSTACKPPQLQLTLGRFFKHVDAVHLLAIPRSIPRVEQTLQFDFASTGEKFGHLYKGLDLAAEVKSQKVVRRVHGEWQLGELEF